MIISQLARKFFPFYETWRFCIVLLRTCTGHYPEPLESTPYPHTFYFNIHFNLIFPSTCRSSKWSLPFGFSNQNFVCFFIGFLCSCALIRGLGRITSSFELLFQRVSSRTVGRNASITVLLDGASSVHSHGLPYGHGRQNSWEQWYRGLWGQDEGLGSEVSLNSVNPLKPKLI